MKLLNYKSACLVTNKLLRVENCLHNFFSSLKNRLFGVSKVGESIFSMFVRTCTPFCFRIEKFLKRVCVNESLHNTA